MNYSSFIPTIDRTTDVNIARVRSDFINQYVERNNLILLKCDYFGVDNYYYNNATKTMYKVCNVYNKYIDTGITPIFEISNDTHILELNNL